MSVDYADYLQAKALSTPELGWEPGALPDAMLDYQRTATQRSVRLGRSALWLATGMGKTLCQLAWADEVRRRSGLPVLLLAPLAVGQQTVAEAEKFGVDGAAYRRCEDEGRAPITVTNYERIDRFSLDGWGGLVCDEASILRSHTGVYRRAIQALADAIPYRLSATATPMPNDLMELTNQAEFVGAATGREIIARWFIGEEGGAGKRRYRLKRHAERDWWRWVSGWAVAARKPSDLGHPDEDVLLALPELRVHWEPVDGLAPREGALFGSFVVTMADHIASRRTSMTDRCARAAELASSTSDQWIIWCELNEESDRLTKMTPDAVEVRGSDSLERKEDRLLAFARGEARVLVTKPSIAGHGLNLQGCHRMAFVGLTHSWESWHQTVRRCWRFGQSQPVDVHVVHAQADAPILANVQRKEQEATKMMDAMVNAMGQLEWARGSVDDYEPDQSMKLPEWFDTPAAPANAPLVVDQRHDEGWTMYQADCVEAVDGLPDGSVHLSVFSPPFPAMYMYLGTARDVSNTGGIDDLVRHFGYLMAPDKLMRATMPGRLCVVHLMQLPSYSTRDGIIGIQDFRGPVIAMAQAHGWAYASEVVIDKDPQVQAVRHKEHGLLFKTLATDSTRLRSGLADYLLVFRAPGANPVPVRAGNTTRYSPGSGWVTEADWVEWAAPVWRRAQDGRPGGVRETDVLNVRPGRADDDERHVCLAEGSLVLTRDGYLPIERVEVGDLVLTHEGRWRPVEAKRCNGVAEVIRTCGQGVADLRTTPDHQLWTRLGIGTDAKRQAKKRDPEWVAAERTLGSYLNVKLPPVEDSPLTVDEWWIVGRWLGDGHVGVTRAGHGRPQFFISCAHGGVDGLVARLGEHAGHVAGRRTASQIALRGLRPEAVAVLARCGRGAAGKRVPGEGVALSPEKAEALLYGYLSADGHYVAKHDRWAASSVSRALLLGMALVAQRARGVVASVYAGRPPRKHSVDGRVVEAKQDWIFAFRNSPGYKQSGWIGDDGAWGKVRKQQSIDNAVVWDISVAEDESFTAEGAIVKNCPLQLGVSERVIRLYSAPGETVLSPFAGVGSEGVSALRCGRRFVGIELKDTYFAEACRHLAATRAQPDLFSEAT